MQQIRVVVYGLNDLDIDLQGIYIIKKCAGYSMESIVYCNRHSIDTVRSTLFDSVVCSD